MAEPKTPERSVAVRADNFKAHVFSGSKGGTGKTSVLFQAAPQWAKDHPSDNVLVVDCSFAGDISERLLGGAAEVEGQTVGEKAFYALNDEGKSARHLFKHLKTTLPAEVEITPEEKSHGKFYAAFRRFSIGGPPTGGPPTRKEGVDNIVHQFGVRVGEINPNVTLPNLFLIPGGASGKQPCTGMQLTTSEERRMARSLRSHLAQLPGTWRVFFDTDGELDMSTSMRILARACDTVVMFTETDPSDFRRVRVFTSDLYDMRLQQMEVMDLCAGVAAICFNKVQPDPKLEPFEELGCKVKPHMVSVRDLINSFAEKLSRFILDPALASTAGLNMFVNVPAAVPGANEDRVKAFKRSAFMVMQDFKKLGFLGSDLGVPFCCMEVNKSYRGEHGEYTVDNEALLVRLIQNVQELNQRL